MYPELSDPELSDGPRTAFRHCRWPQVKAWPQVCYQSTIAALGITSFNLHINDFPHWKRQYQLPPAVVVVSIVPFFAFLKICLSLTEQGFNACRAFISLQIPVAKQSIRLFVCLFVCFFFFCFR